MSTALSPRITSETYRTRLRSTAVLAGEAPRRVQSALQARALGAGFTVKAGPVTEARLRRPTIRVRCPRVVVTLI